MIDDQLESLRIRPAKFGKSFVGLQDVLTEIRFFKLRDGERHGRPDSLWLLFDKR